MDYMDYGDDACLCMFTAGQSKRMDATLYGARSSIVGSDGLIPPPSAVTAVTANLWSQDTPKDIGAEPDTVSDKMWDSDDIWVRNTNDGIGNQDHQNPVYRPAGLGSNFVYVRIRNRGCMESASSTVKLYWASLGWPAPWDGTIKSPALMGGLIGTKASGKVPGGSYSILEFPWYPPNPDDYNSFGGDKTHFCLLSRIETSSTFPFGMTFKEGPDLNANVRNNNKIVWKNVTVVGPVPAGAKLACTTIGGIRKRKGTSLAKLVFTTPEKERDESIFSWGTVKIDLGEKLFKKWKAGGSVGAEIKIDDKYWIKIAGPNAWIGNLKLTPKELYTICVKFERYPNQQEGNDIFVLDLTQYSSEGKVDRVVGGQTFIMKTVPYLKS